MQVRPATVNDAAAIAHVHVASWRTTYAGLLPDELLAKLDEEKRTAWWTQVLEKNQSLTFVAVDNAGEVVGFASGGKQRDDDFPQYDGEIYAIYLLEATQRQGIGRRLTVTLTNALHDAGYKSLLVWVLKGNPAIAFYRALGGQYITEKTEPMGPVEVTEEGYGWLDISSIRK